MSVFPQLAAEIDMIDYICVVDGNRLFYCTEPEGIQEDVTIWDS